MEGQEEVNVVGLIPARGGSKRLPGKNISYVPYTYTPRIAFTIHAAFESGIFNDEIYVSTDHPKTAEISRSYCAKVIDRPAEYATDTSQDIGWISHALRYLEDGGLIFDAFFILRPTNAFRTAETIQKAWYQFRTSQPCHSLRSVRPVKERWQKMWTVCGDRIVPACDYYEINGLPCYEQQAAAFVPTYVQDGCVHIAWCEVIRRFGNISGEIIKPYFSDEYEGFDINDKFDAILEDALISGNSRPMAPIPTDYMRKYRK